MTTEGDLARRKELVVECGDGHTRKVTVDPHTHLISRSIVVEPVHTSELSERQRQGLGLPVGYVGPLMGVETSQPTIQPRVL